MMTLRSTFLAALLTSSTVLAGCSTAAEEDTAQSEDQLKTEMHRSITEEFCIRLDISEGFCKRVGSEAFLVDAREWDRSWMHAIPSLGKSHCEGTVEVQDHLTRRGKEIHDILAVKPISRANVDKLAESLGRALHTIQDNCAHQGQSNAEHSWHSISDWCHGTDDDPDQSPQAIECARNETKLVMRAFNQELRETGHEDSELNWASDIAAPQPGLSHVCEFLEEWKQFDGKDSRWDIGVTVPAFRTSLNNAILTGGDSPNACAGLDTSGGDPIAVRNPHPPHQVNGADMSCASIDLVCRH